jgi:outer membrane protein TolC
MIMKRLCIVFTGILFCLSLSAQQPDTLKLQNCLNLASVRNPAYRQKNISGQILSDKLKNITNNWFPSAGLNAQALYNSETIDFSDIFSKMPVPVSVPSLPLDQYKVWADINQQIYDGGVNRTLKQAEKADYNTSIQQTEVDLLAARQQVNQVYFSLLLTQKNTEILAISLEELMSRRKMVESGVRNGAVLSDNLLAMDAEVYNMQQKLTEVRLMRSNLIRILSVLIDSTVNENVVVSQPDQIVANESGIRPEFSLFESQKEKISVSQKLIAAGDLPKFFAFSQIAYGRPGFNMISNDFHSFYSVGAGMKWNFLNYGDSKRQKKVLELQKELVDVKKDNFSNQLQIQLLTEKMNIEKYDSLIVTDEKILNIRKSITVSSFSKLNNGIITSTDYLTDMNAEMMARLQFENHKILRMQSACNYALLEGKL